MAKIRRISCYAVDTAAQGKLRELMLDAYAEWEVQATVAS